MNTCSSVPEVCFGYDFQACCFMLVIIDFSSLNDRFRVTLNFIILLSHSVFGCHSLWDFL